MFDNYCKYRENEMMVTVCLPWNNAQLLDGFNC